MTSQWTFRADTMKCPSFEKLFWAVRILVRTESSSSVWKPQYGQNTNTLHDTKTQRHWKPGYSRVARDAFALCMKGIFCTYCFISPTVLALLCSWKKQCRAVRQSLISQLGCYNPDQRKRGNKTTPSQSMMNSHYNYLFLNHWNGGRGGFNFSFELSKTVGNR